MRDRKSISPNKINGLAGLEGVRGFGKNLKYPSCALNVKYVIIRMSLSREEDLDVESGPVVNRPGRNES